jgi:hypothetical protein
VRGRELRGRLQTRKTDGASERAIASADASVNDSSHALDQVTRTTHPLLLLALRHRLALTRMFEEATATGSRCRRRRCGGGGTTGGVARRRWRRSHRIHIWIVTTAVLLLWLIWVRIHDGCRDGRWWKCDRGRCVQVDSTSRHAAQRLQLASAQLNSQSDATRRITTCNSRHTTTTQLSIVPS